MRGLLDAHGVQCCIWHDHAATLYAGDGFLRCSLAIEDDDLEYAAEVLNHPAGEIPDVGEEVPTEIPANIYPDTLTLFVTGLAWSGIITFLLLVVREAEARSASRIPLISPIDSGVSPEQALGIIIHWLLSGLFWAGSTALLLWPLHSGRDRPWTFLRTYVFGRWIFPFVVIVPLLIVTRLLSTLGIPANPFAPIP